MENNKTNIFLPEYNDFNYGNLDEYYYFAYYWPVFCKRFGGQNPYLVSLLETCFKNYYVQTVGCTPYLEYDKDGKLITYPYICFVVEETLLPKINLLLTLIEMQEGYKINFDNNCTFSVSARTNELAENLFSKIEMALKQPEIAISNNITSRIFHLYEEAKQNNFLSLECLTQNGEILTKTDYVRSENKLIKYNDTKSRH